ncbi:MAG TPA: hypothetical protein VIA07_11255 [Desulfuromonadales bacterium]|jgi:hypothetical protein
MPGLLGIGQVLQDNNKFITTVTRHRIDLPDPAGQFGGNVLEDRVSRLVPQGVIDRLKMVEVDEKNFHQLMVATSLGQRLNQTVFQKGAIGQTGQRVTQGNPQLPPSKGKALGYVGDHPHGPQKRPCSSTSRLAEKIAHSSVPSRRRKRKSNEYHQTKRQRQTTG